jgi:hypothetical protein
MIVASCHCGAVLLEITEAPPEITDCNCSICRRYGVLWAYYSPRQVVVRAGMAPIVICGATGLLRFTAAGVAAV